MGGLLIQGQGLTRCGCTRRTSQRARFAATSKGCYWNQDVAGLLAGLPGVAVTQRQDALGSLVTACGGAAPGWRGLLESRSKPRVGFELG